MVGERDTETGIDEAGGEDAGSSEATNEGMLTDTYVAALQHDLADLPPGTTRVGVVRKPTPWFHGAVDENYPELGPPADLLESFRQREEDFKMQGLCEEGAHNAAWDELGFEEAYREYLEESNEAQSALEELESRLADGESIALVCYENTEQKRCHRTILRDALSSGNVT